MQQDETGSAKDARPGRKAIRGVAAEWLARDLVAGIPAFRIYADEHGADVLIGHVLEATRGLLHSENAAVNVAEHLGELTGVDAVPRTTVLVRGYERHKRDAEVLVTGGWIREAGMTPPFDGSYAEAVWTRSGKEHDVVVFRIPELDAVGCSNVILTQSLGNRAPRLELADWEELSGFSAVKQSILPFAESKSIWLLRSYQGYYEKLSGSTQLAHLNDDFAAAEFIEASPEERLARLSSLGHALTAVDRPEDVATALRRLGAIAKVVDDHGIEIAPAAGPEGPRP